MRDEFQGQYVFWNTQEYLDLIQWMRRYNLTHPDRPQLRFVGNDLGYAGPDAFGHVTDYLAVHRPDLAGPIADLYAGLKPAAGTQAGPWMLGQLTKELPARRTEADRADAALALLRDHGHPRTAGRDTERAHAWALQNAAAITQSFTGYAFPDEQFPERMRYRDRAMVANTAWWLRQEGGRILLASNNGHVAYTSDNPDEFPEPTGAFLRTQLGRDYVNIGLTFNQGTVNALPDFAAQRPQEYTVTPAPKGYKTSTPSTSSATATSASTCAPRPRQPAPGSPQPAPPVVRHPHPPPPRRSRPHPPVTHQAEGDAPKETRGSGLPGDRGRMTGPAASAAAAENRSVAGSLATQALLDLVITVWRTGNALPGDQEKTTRPACTPWPSRRRPGPEDDRDSARGAAGLGCVPKDAGAYSSTPLTRSYARRDGRRHPSGGVRRSRRGRGPGRHGLRDRGTPA